MGNDGNPLNNVENSFLALLLNVPKIDFVPKCDKFREFDFENFTVFFSQTFSLMNYNKFKITQFLLNNLI